MPFAAGAAALAGLIALAYLALPAAGAPRDVPDSRRAASPPTSSVPTAATRSRSSSSAGHPVPLRLRTAAPSSATGSRTACCCSRGRPGRRRRRAAGAPARDVRVRRAARAAARRARRGREPLPLYRRGRPAVALPRRRGDRRDCPLLARGALDQKVRQSVSRLEAAGYRADAASSAASTTRRPRSSTRLRPLARRRARARLLDGDGLAARAHQPESVVVLARDADGRVRGFLHFVPSYGRAAMSLSFMRRDRDDPERSDRVPRRESDRAAARARDRGAVAQLRRVRALALRAAGPARAALGRSSLGDRFFQIERLYRFNAKFDPRWEPRYLVFEGALGLPRVGLAAMLVEGQLPRLSFTRA